MESGKVLLGRRARLAPEEHRSAGASVPSSDACPISPLPFELLALFPQAPPSPVERLALLLRVGGGGIGAGRVRLMVEAETIEIFILEIFSVAGTMLQMADPKALPQSIL